MMSSPKFDNACLYILCTVVYVYLFIKRCNCLLFLVLGLRVIMSVNDKWHYCHNSDVLVGSRAMRDRHLQLLGYIILQVGVSKDH